MAQFRNIVESGSGDVVGPGSSTDNTVVRYDGTTGKLIQTSGIIIDDSNNVTNINIDANGSGNSISNIDVADLSNGTDGELITWDAAGAPATVSTGTSGQVLTSNGAGAAPTFQAAAGSNFGTNKFTTATTWAAADSLGGATNCQVVIDATDVTSGTIDVQFDSVSIGEVIAGDKETFLREATGDVDIISSTDAFDVSTGSYDSKTISVNSEDTEPYGFYIKSDGTKMYFAGNTGDSIYQYTMSTPWDISTASYDSKSKSVNSEDTAPSGVSFKSDGTKMYVGGTTNATVFQYTLSTAWDVSTASYDSVSFDATSTAGGIENIFFKSDGTKMYIPTSTEIIHQYTLGTAWDLSTVSYDYKSFNTSGQDSSLRDLYIKSDGTKVYTVGSTSDTVYQYSLGTPWDISTASYDSKTLTYGEGTFPIACFFKTDETKLYVMDNSGSSVFQYSITSSFSGDAYASINY